MGMTRRFQNVFPFSILFVYSTLSIYGATFSNFFINILFHYRSNNHSQKPKRPQHIFIWKFNAPQQTGSVFALSRGQTASPVYKMYIRPEDRKPALPAA